MHLIGQLTLLLLAAAAAADVQYVEEVTTSSVVKESKYTTVNKVYIKDTRQKVRSTISANKKTAKALQKQGQELDASTIVQVDGRKLYSINHVANTYVQKRLPSLKPAAKGMTYPDMSATKPEIDFRFKELDDTKEINGVVCRRVAAEMRARYYRAGTKQLRKENRYLYQAWMATDFPGSAEIANFNQSLAKTSSHPSGTGGGLEQLRNAVENYDELAAQVSALEGFPMQSQIKVYVKAGDKKEKQVFQITRKVTDLSSSTIAASEFRIAKGLKRVKK